MKAEIITWLDHHSLADGWVSHEEALKEGSTLKQVVSIGYIISENKDVVIMASDLSDDFLSRCITIAKKLIKSRQKLVIKSK